MFQIYANAGQVCDARSRIFVQEPVYDDFLDAFVERTGRPRVGDPTDAANHIGVITSERQLERVEHYVEIGQKEGARLVVGGRGWTRGADPSSGRRRSPTWTTQCRSPGRRSSGPWRIGRFSDYDDGIAKANDTPYGLATVWTSDLATAHRAAHDIRAGGVWVNTSEFLFNESPFGGMKASGFGRELSMHGMEGYTEVKNVGISIGAEGPTFEL